MSYEGKSKPPPKDNGKVEQCDLDADEIEDLNAMWREIAAEKKAAKPKPEEKRK